MSSSLLSIIKDRRSIRRYQPRQAVPSVVLERLLTAAVWAPSAHNRQPWRFMVITTVQLRDRLATAMGEQLRQDLTTDHVPTHRIEADVQRSYARITQAPALILVCMSMADMDVYNDARRAHAEWLMAAQSTAMAVQNLLLAAHAEGLGACWMCAPLFCAEVVVNVLDLPSDWQPQALITLGYPAEDKQAVRRPLPERVLWR